MSDELGAPFADQEVARDTLFDLLSSPRRRFTLYYLHEEARTIELGELTEQVAAWEYDKPVEELTSQERKRVYVSLYQTHLPKLADAGIIEYDADSGQITLTDHIDEFGPYLGWSRRELPWGRYYLALAVASAVLYSLVTFEVSVFGQLPEFAAGMGIVVSFALLALAQYYLARRASVEMPRELVSER